MKSPIILLLLTCMSLAFTNKSNFIDEQKRYERVRTALDEKENKIKKVLSENDLELNSYNLLFIAYKDIGELELYAKKKNESEYSLLKTYSICEESGSLGPKRKQGDYQVPEGFYHIDRYNPSSNFYLSLGINYPNQSDRKKSNASNLGGDIFIHGNCFTIGCLPMTDDSIKEIYLYAVYAKNNGQSKIPVYIFPFKMTDQNFIKYSSNYKANKGLVAFWKNLKRGYDSFISDKTELKVRVLENGDYAF